MKYQSISPERGFPWLQRKTKVTPLNPERRTARKNRVRPRRPTSVRLKRALPPTAAAPMRFHAGPTASVRSAGWTSAKTDDGVKKPLKPYRRKEQENDEQK
jgi:hypothetical protein